MRSEMIAVRIAVLLTVLLSAATAFAGGGGGGGPAAGGGSGPEPEVYAMALFSLLPGVYFARRALAGERRGPSAE